MIASALTTSRSFDTGMLGLCDDDSLLSTRGGCGFSLWESRSIDRASEKTMRQPRPTTCMCSMYPPYYRGPRHSTARALVKEGFIICHGFGRANHGKDWAEQRDFMMGGAHTFKQTNTNSKAELNGRGNDEVPWEFPGLSLRWVLMAYRARVDLKMRQGE